MREEPEQVFATTRAMALVAADLHAILALSPEQLSEVLDAARNPESELRNKLMRALPRRSRKLFENAAAELAATPSSGQARWRSDVLRAVTRLAALVCDDVTAATNGLDPKGAVELGLYWLSDDATALRAALLRPTVALRYE